MKHELKILKNTLHIGIEKPIRFLHITDTHITRGFQHERGGCFNDDFENCAEEYFLMALSYAQENDLLILHTGDVIDYLSPENFDFVESTLGKTDYLYAAGNHDFCHCVGAAKEDHAYKWEMIRKIAPHIKSNLYFNSRIVGGVNMVTLDNSYYLITDGQIDLLKAEAAKGYPILLGVHVPFYVDDFGTIAAQRDEPTYAIATPEEVMARYSEDRQLQQTPDKATLRALDYIKSEPLIRAVIAGHKHLNHEGMLTAALPQFVTDGSFAGYVREFTID